VELYEEREAAHQEQLQQHRLLRWQQQQSGSIASRGAGSKGPGPSSSPPSSSSSLSTSSTVSPPTPSTTDGVGGAGVSSYFDPTSAPLPLEPGMGLSRLTIKNKHWRDYDWR
jgi:hypothetical protein